MGKNLPAKKIPGMTVEHYQILRKYLVLLKIILIIDRNAVGRNVSELHKLRQYSICVRMKKHKRNRINSAEIGLYV